MEMLELFNKEGKSLNKSIARGDKNFAEGEYIKLTTIWLKSNDKYLIQKCSEEKGREYAVSGGHVQAGKTSAEQAVLELQEELGLDIDEKDLTFLGNIYRKHAIFDVYGLENEKLINQEFTLQEEEVESVHWFTEKEISGLIEEGNFRKTSAEQFEQFIQKEKNDDMIR